MTSSCMKKGLLMTNKGQGPQIFPVNRYCHDTRVQIDKLALSSVHLQVFNSNYNQLSRRCQWMQTSDFNIICASRPLLTVATA